MSEISHGNCIQLSNTELHIRGGIKVNSDVIFLISQ